MITFGRWLELRAEFICEARRAGMVSVEEANRAELDTALGEYSGPVRYLDGTEEKPLCVWIVKETFGVETPRGTVIRQPLRK